MVSLSHVQGVRPHPSRTENKSKGQLVLFRYLYTQENQQYKVLHPRTGQLLVCHIARFVLYNPNFDPMRLCHRALPLHKHNHKRVNADHVVPREACSGDGARPRDDPGAIHANCRTSVASGDTHGRQASRHAGYHALSAHHVTPSPVICQIIGVRQPPTIIFKERKGPEAQLSRKTYVTEAGKYETFARFRTLTRAKYRPGRSSSKRS